MQHGARSAAPLRVRQRPPGASRRLAYEAPAPCVAASAALAATTVAADESVRLQLLKHGFTPAANEAWRLDYSLVFGSSANEEPAATTAEQDVTLPSWLL